MWYRTLECQALEPNNNVFEWHANSHPFTKNDDGTPKTFYHGTINNFDQFAHETPRPPLEWRHEPMQGLNLHKATLPNGSEAMIFDVPNANVSILTPSGGHDGWYPPGKSYKEPFRDADHAKQWLEQEYNAPMPHGSRAIGAHFATEDKDWANLFAGSPSGGYEEGQSGWHPDHVKGANVFPGYIHSQNPFDPGSPEGFQVLEQMTAPFGGLAKLFESLDDEDYSHVPKEKWVEAFSTPGSWGFLEELDHALRFKDKHNGGLTDRLKKLGYDSYLAQEKFFNKTAPSIAFFEPHQFKSIWNANPTTDPRINK